MLAVDLPRREEVCAVWFPGLARAERRALPSEDAVAPAVELRSPQQRQVFADGMVGRGEILHCGLQVSRVFQTGPGHDGFFA